MSYLIQGEIAVNPSMQTRVAQAAASEGSANPDYWMSTHARTWAAAPGWDAAWESALVTHSGEPDYDPGADEGVVTDSMILSQVQGMGVE